MMIWTLSHKDLKRHAILEQMKLAIYLSFQISTIYMHQDIPSFTTAPHPVISTSPISVAPPSLSALSTGSIPLSTTIPLGSDHPFSPRYSSLYQSTASSLSYLHSNNTSDYIAQLRHPPQHRFLRLLTILSMVFLGNFVLGAVSLILISSANENRRKNELDQAMTKESLATSLLKLWPLMLIFVYVFVVIARSN